MRTRPRATGQAEAQVVVITGASSGNGLAAAHAFARRGARLVLAARGKERLETAAEQCRRLGGEAIACPTDVGDAASVEGLARAAVDRFGAIDVWVNNAGVLHYGRFDETPPDVVDQVVRTNLTGCMNGSRVALRRFRRQGRGVLINVSSILGETGHPFTAAYVASKFAIRGFTESLREEVRDQPNVHVCAVLPAAIDTPIYQRAANFTGRRVRPIWFLYGPQTVGRTIVALARRPRREAYAGRYGRLVVLGRRLAPGLAEAATWAAAEVMEIAPSPAPHTRGNVAAPLADPCSLSGGWRRRYAPGWLSLFAGVALGAAVFQARRARAASRSIHV